MRILAIVTIAAMSLATPSFAQSYDRGGGTQAFVSMCIRNGAHLSVPEPTCACGAGVISGRMNDRQYEIMRRFAPHTGNQAAMNAEIRRMISDGYSAQEIQVVGQMLIDLAPLIDMSCRVLER
ncbi:MAG: hypothetical protein R3C30_05805 [Hyphomonadaceae bacterium]